MRYFMFVDTPYYPYVDDPIEADSLNEARAKAAQSLRPGDNTTIYLAPMECVEALSMSGPRERPKGILALQEEMNRLTEARLQAAMLGGFSVVVEPGSTQPD